MDEQAQRLCNSWMSAYLESALEHRLQPLNARVEWLDSQLDDVRTQRDTARQTLAELEEGSPELEAARADLQSRESTLAQVRDETVAASLARTEIVAPARITEACRTAL